MGNSAGCIVYETLLGSINVSRRSVLVGLQFLSGTIDRYVTVSQFNTVVLRAPRAPSPRVYIWLREFRISVINCCVY